MNQYIESAQRIFPQFEYYRRNHGGKAAGLKLLEQILRNSNLPNSHIYELLPFKFLSLNLYNYYKSHEYNHSSVKRIILPENTINSKNMFHFRSSSTLEDWVNLDLFGTFETVSRVIESKGDINKAILELFQEFKYFQENEFISEDDSLGIVIMPSLCETDKFKKINIQVDTFNDEKGEVIRVETSQSRFFEDQINLSQLIDYRSQNNIEIYQLSKDYYSGSDYKDSFNFNNPYEINGKRTSITKTSLEKIVNLTRLCKESLGFEVNMEYVILEYRKIEYHKNIFTLQLRPSRIQNKLKKVKLDDNYILLGKTPCVFNEFDLELPLLFRERNKYSDDFGNSDYFSVHRDRRQFNRIRGNSSKYSQLKGVVGIDSGFALNHDTQLLPHVFYGRNEFKYLGMPHIKDDILNLLTNYIGVHRNLISEIPLRFQSNGRYGQVSINKKHMSKLHYHQESMKLKRLNKQIKEIQLSYNVPF